MYPCVIRRSSRPRIYYPFPLLLVFLLAGFSSCVSPVNSLYEGARTLGRGRTEVHGHYSHYLFAAEGESGATNNNLGARIGYGVTDWLDVKARYEFLISTIEDVENANVHYISLAPKVGIWPRIVAARLPFGVYLYEGGKQFVMSPQAIFSAPTNNNVFEATFATKLDIPLGGDVEGTFLGFNLGFGISRDLDRWAIRPEVGALVNPGETGTYWTAGVGFTHSFGFGDGSR